MGKKKVVFLSNMAFDANLSIIKYLREIYDVYFYTICRGGVYGRIGTFELNNDITVATEVSQFKILNEFLDLEKTFLIKHYSYSEQGIRSITNKIKIDVKLLGMINQINPKAILIDTYDFPLIRVFNKSKIIILQHDPFPHSGENTILRKVLNWSMKKYGTYFILFNEKQKKDFAEYFNIPTSRIFISFLSVYEILNIYDNGGVNDCRGKNIFFWGRISKYKGIDYLIEGFKKYIQSTGDNNASLTIAGDGDYYFDIDNATLGYENIKVIKRYLSMSELVQMIKSCYFTVCPYTDATQSGVIMTSFALKKPVLATRVGGLPEMLNNGKLGMLIEPKSSDAICEAIKILFADPGIIDCYSKCITNTYFGDSIKSWRNAIKGISSAIESL